MVESGAFGDDAPKELRNAAEVYSIFMAADRCHCAPWELLKQPRIWHNWAQDILAVEAEVGIRRIG